MSNLIGIVLVAILTLLGTIYVGNKSKQASDTTTEQKAQADLLTHLQTAVASLDARLSAADTRGDRQRERISSLERELDESHRKLRRVEARCPELFDGPTPVV